jgi:hypothetical protein
VNKPEGGDYSLRHVAELREGVYLLTIDAPKPELSNMVYNENKTNEPLKHFGTTFNDKIYEVMSIGPWLYFFEYNVDANGAQLEAPLHVISKETEQEVFLDKCLIASNTEY